MLPMHITGILNELFFVKFLFKNIKKRTIKEKGNNKIEIKPIFLSQNFGFIIII